MKKLKCGDCEHWEPADNLAVPVNGGAPGGRTGRAGWCYLEPPKAMVGQVPNALGHPQMQVTSLRPPVEDHEKACGSFELSSELEDANTPIDVDPV